MAIPDVNLTLRDGALGITTATSDRLQAKIGTSSLGDTNDILVTTDQQAVKDAYGTGPVPRTITSLRGRVRHGDSGAPAVDAHGAVQTTIFAARLGSVGGFGVPADVVRVDLAAAAQPVPTGDCAP